MYKFNISLIGCLLAVVSLAHSEPPPGLAFDPGLSAWYRDLKQPDTQLGCCSMADCRPVDYRFNKDGSYEVFIKEKDFPYYGRNQWIAVPPEKILRTTSNPTGSAVVCWAPVAGILCFVPGYEV